MEQEIKFQPWSNRKIIDYLEQARKRATDERPVRIKLIRPELLPWEGMNVIPKEGAYLKVIQQPIGYGKKREDIVVDFSLVTSADSTGNYTPHACFPVSATKMSVGGEIFIDCQVVIKIGFMPNLFQERSLC